MALRAKGREVTLIDGGLQLEPRRDRMRQQLAALPRADWPADVIAVLKEQPPATVGGVPIKYSFGSDYPYREVDGLLPYETVDCSTQPTLARGGFSTVWGSAILPYLQEDIEDWPIRVDDLEPHYRAVARWMPVSAVTDELAQEFPIYAEHPTQLAPSAQARALMRDLDSSRERLRRAGIRAGWSRLAVRADDGPDGPGCVSCGMCMSGCPYGLIYDSSATLRQLEAEPGFRAIPNVVIDRVEDRGDAVEVTGRDRVTGERREFSAERVIVACGVLSTTRLLLASLEAYDRPVRIRDSQYFLLPLLRAAGSGKPRHEDLHTLSQIFIELRDPSVTRHNSHLQVYGYNELYESVFDGLLGPLRRPAAPIVDAVLSRLMLIQGYLHSDESPHMEARLVRDSGPDRLILTEHRNPATRPAVRRLGRRLLRLAPQLRALPILPALQIAPAGRGFHSGGSFPMRADPGEMETDVVGRLGGRGRVHLADSSVLPSIPATTITYTVMANAHRIATLCADL